MPKAKNAGAFRVLRAASIIATLVFFIAAALCLRVSAGSLDIYLPESEEARYFVPETEGGKRSCSSGGAPETDRYRR